jgi:hypothetical protein
VEPLSVADRRWLIEYLARTALPTAPPAEPRCGLYDNLAEGRCEREMGHAGLCRYRAAPPAEPPPQPAERSES